MGIYFGLPTKVTSERLGIKRTPALKKIYQITPWGVRGWKKREQLKVLYIHWRLYRKHQNLAMFELA